MRHDIKISVPNTDLSSDNIVLILHLILPFIPQKGSFIEIGDNTFNIDSVGYSVDKQLVKIGCKARTLEYLDMDSLQEYKPEFIT